MAGYRVTAPLVIAHRDGGTSVHVVLPPYAAGQ